jgi:hypothetical protein
MYESNLQSKSKPLIDTHRKTIFTDVDKLQRNLKATGQSVFQLLDKLNATEQIILKRLEWAVGALPTLHDTIKTFETKRKKRNDLYKVSRPFGISGLGSGIDRLKPI